MNFSIRNATADDIDGIMQVEQSWPKAGRAGPDKFHARLEKFPQGFFLAITEGRIVATITSCMIHYDPANPHVIGDWSTVTNNGKLHDQSDPKIYNSIYIVSGVIDSEYRGDEKIFSSMVLKVFSLGQKTGFEYVLAGAILPGYARYVEKHGDLPAPEYALLKKGNKPIDPLISMYHRIGFHIPGHDHVMDNYFQDDASLNHAALVVRKTGD